MTDDDFLREFEECRLAKALWTHQAHVRMAWLYLSQKPLEDVIPIVRERIQRYNRSLGNTSGYHETVTVAYLSVIDDRLRRSQPFETFEAFAERHPDLIDRTMSTLLGHYSRELLFAPEAFERFVEPDLAPLPRRAGLTAGG